MNTEQECADFEAWANGRCGLHLVNPAGRYSSAITQFAWEAYQAGRAALRSQDQEDAESCVSRSAGQRTGSKGRAMNDSDLKYIQRVLEGHAPDEDRERAAQMVRDIRRSYGRAPAASAEDGQ